MAIKVPTEGSEQGDAARRPQCDGEAVAPRLDEATISPHGPWVLTAWVDCGEGTVVWNVPSTDRIYVPPGEGADPERAAAEAARRAATTLRRYCTANDCDKLWSLTYRCRRCNDPTGCKCPEGPDRPGDGDLDRVWADVQDFRDRLAAELGGRFPLALVVEHHADGSLHVHGASARFIDKAVLARCWGRGWVDARRVMGAPGMPNGVGAMSKRQRCRIVAHYLASYLKKDFTEGHQFGRNRYSCARGFTPVSRSVRLMRRTPARAWFLEVMGSDPDHVWDSADLPDWDKPPVTVAYWNGPP